MKLQELKDKLNSLTDEQLSEDAIVFVGDSEVGSLIDSWDEQQQDIYWHDGECYGMLSDVHEYLEKENDPDDPMTIEDFRKVPKGFFTLHAQVPAEVG